MPLFFFKLADEALSIYAMYLSIHDTAAHTASHGVGASARKADGGTPNCAVNHRVKAL